MLRREGCGITTRQCSGWGGADAATEAQASAPWGVPVRATHEDHVWTYDFLHDRTESARQCGC
ncbi:protein of unknown function [Candidatus Bipolaricaulis anaerobius]|uniref:Uncharacterized protein n=1 Tax=Candidatus Bipolaricaulis anaerobius TaxID=2026885 RepID=A0A2X3K7H8_9BACT|nr:protein of unknown function [Candidatus Bipolaricaulis anaerobius]